MTSGVTPWARITTAAPFVDLVERVDGPDALRLEFGDHAFVVDDLAERVRRLALARRQLGVVDRLANAVAEPGALGDEDLFHACHLTFEYGMPPPEDPPRAGTTLARLWRGGLHGAGQGLPGGIDEVADHGPVTLRPARVEGEEVARVEGRGVVEGHPRVRLEARRTAVRGERVEGVRGLGYVSEAVAG